MHVNTEMQV